MRFMSMCVFAAAAAVSATAARAAEPARPAPHFQRPAPPADARRDEPVFRQGPGPGPGPGAGRGPGPGFNRPWAPGPRGVQTPQPEFRRGNALPLNNPETLRPNGPAAREGGPAPTTAPAGGPADPPAPAAAIGPSGAVQALAAPARPPVVVRPLPPAGGGAATPRPVDRGRRFVSLHGGRHALVPAAGLGVAVIGDSAWYPDGYVAAEGPACSGATTAGCQLQWRSVGFEDDDEDAQPQCVQYCPQPGPPPPEAAALPQPPPLPEGGGECQTTIYSEPNFAGNSAPTGGSQPILSSTGWRNEIASIVVGAGTWDFYADENFGGEVLRLSPGTYPRLAPEWLRRIGSFLCVRGDVPPA